MRKALEVVFDQHPRGRVARVAIRGEKSLNVVDQGLLQQAAAEMLTVLAEGDLRCIVMSGVNERAFIGGADLQALHDLDASTAEAFIRSIHDFCTVLREAEVPVIAVMRGYCLGGGMEIAAACDVRIGDDSVRVGMPEVKVGLPSVVEAALLPGLIGWGKARELMLRGNIIDAAAAASIGFLQHRVAHDELEGLAAALVDDILAAWPQALAAQKRLFLDWEEQATSGAIESGVRALVDAYRGDEPQRAIDAFFASRPQR